MDIELDLRAPIADGLLEASLIETNAQAAEVCFDRHHRSPILVEVSLDGELQGSPFVLAWNAISDRQKRSHGNALNATEQGAYAVSIAALRLTHGMMTFGRADHLTGADFYAVQQDDVDFENAYRLEVSGTENGDEAELKKRLREKVQQLLAGASNLPGIASVVAFKLAEIRMQSVQDA